MSLAPAALMEQRLLKLAERAVELRHGLYAQFFSAIPARQAAFLCPEATSLRMTDETLQMLYGLAGEEKWVWPLVAELIYTHRAYGNLPPREYDAFIAMVVAELAAVLGESWSEAEAEAWLAQAERLKTMIATAQAEWDSVLPRG